MSTFSMIHIGAEVVIIGGLTFYLNGQIGKVRTRVEVLEDFCGRLKREVEELKQTVGMLASALGARPPPRKIDFRESEKSSPPSITSSIPPPPVVEDDLGEEEIDDSEVKAELETLRRARATTLVIEEGEKN